MSDREKKLLILFCLAGFLILNFLGFNYALAKRAQVSSQRAQAERQLAAAEVARENRDKVADEMEWLAKHEPEPKAKQKVQTELQELAEREAKTASLTLKSQKSLPTDEAGNYYHRAKHQIVVTGTEADLYRWLDRINVPDQFRVASRLLMSPNTQDDTKIDCTAVVEQWFVPIKN